MPTPDYNSLINAAAGRYGVDPNLARSIGLQESGLGANAATAVSTSGAVGPFQLIPGPDGLFHEIAGDIGVNPYDPAANVDAGVRYFSHLQTRYGDDTAALMAYNWGPSNLDSYLSTGVGLRGQPIPAETLNYANSVLTRTGVTDAAARVQSLAGRAPLPSGSSALPLPGAGTAGGGGSASPQDTIHTKDRFVVPGYSSTRGLDLDETSDHWTQPRDPHEPYFATAELWIGDVLVCPTKPLRDISSDFLQSIVSPDIEIPGGPNMDLRLEEFQYRSTTMGGGDQFTFRLFCKSWEDVVQIMALAAQHGDGKTSFGYTNIPGGWVGPFKIRINQITPEFLENGYTVVIDAFSYYGSVNLEHGSHVRGWRAETGRVSDIAEHIGRMNGWKTCIEPTVPNLKHTTYLQHNQTDLNFLNYTLAKDAVSEVQRDYIAGSYGPYVAYLSQDPRDFKPVLHFHPRLPSPNSPMSKQTRSYVWGGVINSLTREVGTVISFKPQFQNTAYTMLGGGKLSASSVEPDHANFNTTTAEGTDINDRVIGGKKGPVDVKMKPDQSVPSRSEIASQHDLQHLNGHMASRYFNFRDYALTATMTVVGDPYIRGGQIVNVLVVRPLDGSIMFYDWMISEAMHTISGGEFAVNLNMFRTAKGPHLEGSGPVSGGEKYSQKVTVTSGKAGIVVGGNYAPNVEGR